MTVRAKFICTGIQQFPSSQEADDGKMEACVASKITMSAVYESPPHDAKDRGNAALENRIFGRATPSAAMEMTIMREEVAAKFKVGASYYLDFTPAS